MSVTRVYVESRPSLGLVLFFYSQNKLLSKIPLNIGHDDVVVNKKNARPVFSCFILLANLIFVLFFGFILLDNLISVLFVFFC